MSSDRVPDEAGEVAPEIGGSAAGRVVEVDGTGEGLDACGKRGMVGDKVADLVLMSSVAEGVYKAKCLFAEFLGEKIREAR